MKKYLVISGIIFLATYLGVNIAKIVFGGNTPVPSFWLMFFILVGVNTITALTVFIIALFKGKVD